MKLPEESIQEFKEIWKKEYGTDITDNQAKEYGEELVGFFRLLIEIDRKKAK